MTEASAAPPDDAPPEWCSRALADEPRQAQLRHAGATLRYRAWGEADNPGLVLIHGAMAHAHWWDFLAPYLADRFHVVAPHLAGMGDSDHRDAYSTARFSDDVIAVMAHAGLSGECVVVGHSLGGAVALTLGHRHGERVRGVVMLDSAVFPPDVPSPFDPAKAPYRPKTICPDYQSAVERFFLLPQQPCPHAGLLRHIVHHSVAQMDGGWSWKFDDALFKKMTLHEQWRELESLQTPLAVIYGDQSAVFTGPARDYFARLASANGWPFIAIPGGHHHLMLDSPQALLGALQGLLCGWPGPP